MIAGAALFIRQLQQLLYNERFEEIIIPTTSSYRNFNGMQQR